MTKATCAEHSFLDRMIALVEGANRQKTPNEIALTLLLAAMTLIFLIVVATLPMLAAFVGVQVDPLLLIALLVCLIPTTIGGLLPAIGIAGMNRALSANVLAKSGKAVEIAGDIDVLLLDKTGTITFGDRQATAFHPLAGIDAAQLRDAALLSSLADPTPEGKSIVRKDLLAAAARAGIAVVDGGCYGATQGPRLETRAEIARMRRDGCDLVGMTGMPEAALARELDLDYACLALVANWAAGCGDEAEISLDEIFANLEHATAQVPPIIAEMLRQS